MIKKIISGGQTGADQAGLDVAINLNIPHGGWIPKGRITENGKLPDKYLLQEMPTSSYEKRTEKNVIESNGTLIISHGKLTGGSKLTQEFSEKHTRPCLHIDLDEISLSKAAQLVKFWIDNNDIEILNIAGPRASSDPRIYNSVKELLEAVLIIPKPRLNIPKTFKDATISLLSILTFGQKTKISRMTEYELHNISLSLAIYIRNEFKLWDGNESLLESCREVSGDPDLDEEEASILIIKGIWEKLKKSHPLKVVK
ncbi:MAG: putative molybdenum carrier protein [Desulfobacterales bacterium]|nr:putative molybdenum carrier protein [Desulfobacterales bacterium]